MLCTWHFSPFSFTFPLLYSNDYSNSSFISYLLHTFISKRATANSIGRTANTDTHTRNYLLGIVAVPIPNLTPILCPRVYDILLVPRPIQDSRKTHILVITRQPRAEAPLSGLHSRHRQLFSQSPPEEYQGPCNLRVDSILEETQGDTDGMRSFWDETDEHVDLSPR